MTTWYEKNGVWFEGAARPFTIYLCTAACVVALFIPSVTFDKLAIVAGLAGGIGALRSVDKSASVKADAAIEIAKVTS